MIKSGRKMNRVCVKEKISINTGVSVSEWKGSMVAFSFLHCIIKHLSYSELMSSEDDNPQSTNKHIQRRDAQKGHRTLKVFLISF